jgi:hypothetical protein
MKINLIKRIVLFSAVTIFLGLNLSAAVFQNWGECLFLPGCDPGTGGDVNGYIPSGESLLGMYLVEGAGYILDAHSGVMDFINRFEMAELNGADYTEMGDILHQVIDNLENAGNIYIMINFIAENTPYNEEMIDRLKTFDYEAFREKNNPYPGVFDRLKGFLVIGDVRGVFAEVSKNIDTLLYQVYALKESTDGAKLPVVRSVWQLNQSFSENLFFGQYFSQILYEVK